MNLLFALSFSFASLYSFGQLQTPFPDSLASWNFQSWQYADPADPNGQTTYSEVTLHARDTIEMNGLIYTRLFADYDAWIYTPENCLNAGNLVGYHRIDGQKVFYVKEPTASWADWAFFEGADYFPQGYSYFHFDTEDEILLYDFGLAVGDSFALTHYDTAVVESIDSVLINDYFYKRINFGGAFADCYWIEGIGSNFGYFPYADTFESGTKSLCFHEYYSTGNFPYVDSISSYEPENGYCWNLSAGSQEIQPQNTFTISPNPVQELLQFNFSAKKNIVEIYNSVGKLIDQFDSKEKTLLYDFSTLNTGMYFIKVNQQVQRVLKY